MTSCRAAWHFAILGFLVYGQSPPVGAQAVEASVPIPAQSASGIPVSATRADLSCPKPSSARRGQRPGLVASTVMVGSVRVTVACAEPDAPKTVQDPEMPKQPASVPGTVSVLAASGAPSSVGSAPSDSKASSLSGEGKTASATIKETNWFAGIAAVLGQLVSLALAIVCALLAWAAFVILREALDLPRRPPRPTDNPLKAPPSPMYEPGFPRRPGSFTFQRHWGGFGGASTGWVLSERLVRVVVGLVLGALAVGLGTQLAPREVAADKAASTSPGAAASAANLHK